ncbi:MAG: Uma2 family endonuclease [Gammaproteobacteria bacterium]|nr:Uma2 family endonuclease [Gammaproteobacteria bacterium]
MYYEEGNPKAVVTPDVFVAYGVPQRTDRRVFKVWEEGVIPDWVLEVTSKSTWREDEGTKRRLYERIGVREYWQFDPTSEYLDPILKGRALGPDGRYVEFVLEERDGGLCHRSEVLGLDLRLVNKRLRFFDPARGEYLLSGLEPYTVVGEQFDLIGEQRNVIDEQRRALRAAEARIRELERRQRPKG